MFRKILVWLLATFFILYGLIRVFGGIMIIQDLTSGSAHFGVQEGADKVTKFFEQSTATPLIPFGALGYMNCIVLMGAMLLLGTIGMLMKKRWGTIVMSSYFVLYVFLFINFQVFNIKIAYLIVSFLLFMLFIRVNREALNEHD